MTHKIKASSEMLLLLIIWSILASIPIGGAIYSLVCSIITGDITFAFFWIFMILVFISFTVLIFIGANRLGCTIEYNEESNTVSRKGLFRKFEYSVNVENIKDVIIVFHGRGGYWIELVDNVQCNYDNFYKKSFIGFQLNDKNIEFLKTFWKQPVHKIMKDGSLAELSDYDKRLYGLK